ncbi:hypothetical protein J7443_07860 [Tropicibacter sp. R15_0]|uniref:hypothetical protein n=1 Tax=Tropicibacter sp. R15_0 TaxID=2821101 RepID=UPI001ADD2154|nr:hypothetical protein [Tropicibacter sp. R15_0]MBO9465138.1 hypothetical protein [Tropicibacter sp. R15_0]
MSVQSEQTTTKEAPPLGRQRAFDTSFVILLVIAIAAATGVAWLHGPGRVVEIMARYLGFLLVLSPKILCGFFVAAAVPILIPREVITRWVGQGSGTRGLAMASLAGALVPGGPMMIFPLAAGFRAAGASTAVLISFVTAWSLYGLNRTVIWEMSFLPIDFVLARVAICLPVPFLLGWLAQKVMR